MTPNERSEKIQLALIRMQINLDGVLTATEELFAAEIRAAEVWGYGEGLKEGGRQAYADAVKIMEGFDKCVCHGSPVTCALANAIDAIRARAREVSK